MGSSFHSRWDLLSRSLGVLKRWVETQALPQPHSPLPITDPKYVSSGTQKCDSRKEGQHLMGKL